VKAAVLARENTAFVDLLTPNRMNGSNVPVFISADAVHPTDAGHQLIARWIYDSYVAQLATVTL
jgi:lysophospholipase L1-like esterase